MPIDTDVNDSMIDITIDAINIKGQYIILAAPIHLSGYLNAAKANNIMSEYSRYSDQTGDSLSLQMGVDEAGRGPLLGSVNVAAAILPSSWSGLIEDHLLKDTSLSLLTDSKKLSEKKRDILYPLIQQQALGYIIAEIPAAVIDQINILQATILGMRLCTEALLEIIAKYLIKTIENNPRVLHIEVLYDGNRCPEIDYPKLAQLGLEEDAIDLQAWVKGDARHTSIAAASVLAKVSRDQRMYQLDAEHPNYGIAKHKGYPTQMHMQAIEEYGVLDEHRRSFGPIARALQTQIYK